MKLFYTITCGSRAIIGAIAALFVLSSTAFAFHPLITDDSGTQGRHNIELEIAYQFDRDVSRGFDRSVESILEGIWGSVTTREDAHELAATISYGLIDPLDLVIGVPYGHSRARESRVFYNPPLPPSGIQGLRYKTTGTDSGIGDPLIELKWMFYEREGLTLAIKPGATLPLGNEDAGFGTGCVSPFLYFIASYEKEWFLIHLNLGYIRNQNKLNDREDLWHGSLAMEFVLVPDILRFVVNTGVERNPDKRSNFHDVFVLGGLVVSPSEFCDLDLGFRYSVETSGSESPAADYSVLAGFTARYDGGAKKEGNKS
ncbi:MAG: transporter [Spirochaetes bacterium]|nr:transporter [Spirochaetota bacterium]